MPSDYENIRSQSQRSIVAFIQTDLELVDAFIVTAQLAKAEGDTERYEWSKTKAIKVIATVRQFLNQVDSVDMQAKLDRRLAQLDEDSSKL